MQELAKRALTTLYNGITDGTERDQGELRNFCTSIRPDVLQRTKHIRHAIRQASKIGCPSSLLRGILDILSSSNPLERLIRAGDDMRRWMIVFINSFIASMRHHRHLHA